MPQQIGWSVEAKLLYELKKLAGGGGGGASLKTYADASLFPVPGTANAIYLALDTNQIYYWDTTTSSYVEISPAASDEVTAAIGLFNYYNFI